MNYDFASCHICYVNGRLAFGHFGKNVVEPLELSDHKKKCVLCEWTTSIWTFWRNVVEHMEWSDH